MCRSRQIKHNICHLYILYGQITQRNQTAEPIPTREYRGEFRDGFVGYATYEILDGRRRDHSNREWIPVYRFLCGCGGGMFLDFDERKMESVCTVGGVVGHTNIPLCDLYG
jgi:hypothetical protein